jgi:hypothetical protein
VYAKEKKVMSNTIERTLLIHSSNRTGDAETPSDFRVLLQTHLESYKLKRVIVKNVSFFNSVPNISPTTRLYLSSAGIEYVIPFKPGQYTADQFLSDFTTQFPLGLNPEELVCNAGSVDANGFCSFSFSRPIKFTSLKELAARGIFKSLNKILGVNYQIPTVTSGVTNTIVMKNTCNFSGPLSVHLHSNALAMGSSFEDGGKTSSVLCVIPMDAEYGTTQTFSCSDHMLNYVDVHPGSTGAFPNKIDFSLRDACDDSIIELSDNSDVSITLMVIFET